MNFINFKNCSKENILYICRTKLVNITKLPMYKRAQMGICYLPQEASVFRKLSVEDNISAVLQMTKLTKGEQSDKL